MLSSQKPLDEQVIVVTGASSGIGMATAEMAAEQGARVVLCARTEPKLEKIVGRLKERGLEASYAVADVANLEDLEHVARLAEDRYGGVDTWVNNAGISIFGRLEDVENEDAHRLFETNFWGVVNGCKAALPVLRRRGGGTIISLGSILSDHAAPLEGIYSASKHAVKAYTDALSMELRKDDEPIAMCLIKPTSVDTPYAHHAKNLMEVEPTLPAPVYAPEVVARAILEMAERPQRMLYIGASARALSFAGELFPRVSDWVGEKFMFRAQKEGPTPEAPWEGHLYEGEPDEEPEREGHLNHHIMRSSLYTEARIHPFKALGVGLLGAGAAWALAKAFRG